MNQIERIADGKRRFFPASGRIESVYLRDKKRHADRALEPGRDYEVERNGVTLSRVPLAGETIVILTGDRVLESGQVTQIQEAPPALVPVERVVERTVPVITERVVEIPKVVTVEKVVERVVPVDRATARSEATTVEPVQDLESLKRGLVLTIWKTNDDIPDRTEAWQDQLAKLTAHLWAAKSVSGVQAAFENVKAFFGGRAA
jgi:hypothetical protein